MREKRPKKRNNSYCHLLSLDKSIKTSYNPFVFIITHVVSMDICILDYYTSKYINLSQVSEKTHQNLTHGDLVVFECQENGKRKLTIGEYLWFDVPTDRTGKFKRVLDGKELKLFEEKQEWAQEIYPSFKKQFRKKFAWSRPVTARYQIFTRQMYCYFYAEQRYNFGDFVRNFQKEIGSALFFFQVGARDMVRLTPWVENRLDHNGLPLHYATKWPLPSIDIEDVLMQNLEGRDMERLKDFSGKLKCSLSYELDTYKAECKHYPAKWQTVKIKDNPETDSVMFCTGYNINTGTISIKTTKWVRYTLPKEEVSWDPKEKVKIEKARKDKRKKPKRYEKSQTKRPTNQPTNKSEKSTTKKFVRKKVEKSSDQKKVDK